MASYMVLTRTQRDVMYRMAVDAICKAQQGV